MFPGLARPAPPLPHRAAAERGPRMRAPGSPRLQREGAGPGAGGPGRGRLGLDPRGGPWGVRSWFGARGVLLLFFFFFFNGQTRPRPSPQGAEALLGGRRGRRGPVRRWHDCRAPGCHFVTAAVVAAGGAGAGAGGRALRHHPDGPGRGGSSGRWPGTLRCAVGPDGCSLPCHRPEALLARRNR